MTTGNYSLDDLKAVRFASAAEFGLDTIQKVLQADLNYYNAFVTEAVSTLAEPITEQSRIYGVSASNSMDELDEYGSAPSRKELTGTTVSFPLKLYGSSLGWTSKYFQIATPAEMAENYLKIRQGHQNQVIKQLKKAIYNNTNYTYVDKMTNGVSLGVKRFLNADSDPIPNSPAGVSFTASSHTHYLARAAGLAATDIDGLVNHVTEHGNTQGLMLVIALADKATVAALTTGFTALTSVHVLDRVGKETDIKVDGSEDLENQLVGYWNQVIPVWVKPWAVANYIACFAVGMPEKPLCFRQRPQSALQGLRIAAELESHPLFAQKTEAEFGFGVWNRTAGAVLYIGNTTWANPTIS